MWQAIRESELAADKCAPGEAQSQLRWAQGKDSIYRPRLTFLVAMVRRPADHRAWGVSLSPVPVLRIVIQREPLPSEGSAPETTLRTEYSRSR